jgi:hypothetical protein
MQNLYVEKEVQNSGYFCNVQKLPKLNSPPNGQALAKSGHPAIEKVFLLSRLQNMNVEETLRPVVIISTAGLKYYEILFGYCINFSTIWGFTNVTQSLVNTYISI